MKLIILNDLNIDIYLRVCERIKIMCEVDIPHSFNSLRHRGEICPTPFYSGRKHCIYEYASTVNGD